MPARHHDDEARQHHAEGNRRVACHVQKRAADIEVAVAPAQEKYRRARIDDDADGGDDHHQFPGDRLRFEEALDRAQRNRARRHQQEHGVEQRRENGCAAQAIGEALRGCAFHQHARHPRHDEAEHVAEIVPGVRDQRHRMADDAECHTDDHKKNVQRDADAERESEIGRRMAVAMTVMMAVTVMPVIVMIVRMRHLNSPRTR